MSEANVCEWELSLDAAHNCSVGNVHPMAYYFI